jgi:heat shock protein HslJ
MRRGGLSATRAPVLAVVVVAAAACGFPLPWDGDEGTLLGTEWQVVSVAGQAPVPGREPTLRLGPDTLSGSGGCNRYSSVTLELELPAIRFGGIGIDDAVCPEPLVMAFEDLYVDTLLTADRLELRNGKLVLSGPVFELVFTQTSD